MLLKMSILQYNTGDKNLQSEFKSNLKIQFGTSAVPVFVHVHINPYPY